MYKNPSNAIQRARLSRGITQEALAERAGYSSDSVRAWESGARACPIEALDILSEILDARWLTVTYLREIYSSGGIAELIPDFRVGRPVAEAAADFIGCVLELVDGRFDRKLLRMVADGKVGDEEQPVYSEIMETASATVRAYYEMRFAARKGD